MDRTARLAAALVPLFLASSAARAEDAPPPPAWAANRARAPPFAYTPYRHRFDAQAYVTTGGYQQHILSYDGFYVADTPYRIRAVLTFERNTAANYFGTG